MSEQMDEVVALLRGLHTNLVNEASLERIAHAGHRALVRRRAVGRTVAAGSAATLGAAALALSLVFVQRPVDDGARTLRLRSGSSMVLSSDATAETRIERGGERVRLEAGHATFHVSPLPPGTSFVVQTPLADVRVVGTTFAVDVGRRGTTVTVTEGSVEVKSRRGETRRLGRGERARVARGGRFEGAVSRAGGPLAVALPVVAAVGASLEVARSEAPAAPAGQAARRARPCASKRKAPREAQATSIEEARRHLLAREYEAAAAAARRAAPSTAARFVLAEALRGAERFDEAAAVYREIADGNDRAAENALFALARLEIEQRNAPGRAVTLSEEHRARFGGGPLAEALASTQFEALLRAGRMEEARGAARDYLARYPAGIRAREAASLVRMVHARP